MVTSISTIEEKPRTSSALDRIVTKARQEIPKNFELDLPGSIPEIGENDEDDISSLASRRRTRLNRRNSAPVNF